MFDAIDLEIEQLDKEPIKPRPIYLLEDVFPSHLKGMLVHFLKFFKCRERTYYLKEHFNGFCEEYVNFIDKPEYDKCWERIPDNAMIFINDPIVR